MSHLNVLFVCKYLLVVVWTGRNQAWAGAGTKRSIGFGQSFRYLRAVRFSWNIQEAFVSPGTDYERKRSVLTSGS